MSVWARETVREVVISAIRDEAEGIRSFRLEAVDGHPLPPALAGAHVDLHLPIGLVRQYSLCNDPAEAGAYLVAVKREPQSRGGSQWLHDVATVGTRILVGTPRSLLAIAPHASRHILLAGGIGVTPLYSMAMALKAEGQSFELHYFARSRANVAFVDALMSEAFEGCAHLHLGVEHDALAGRLDAILAARDEESHLYLCGPVPFMQTVRERASGLFRDDAIHEERFSSMVPAADTTGRFTVTLAKAGITIDIPADRSILDMLMASGRAIEHSCEQGFCGTCMTAVLAGEVDHRDTFLTPEEIVSGAWIMPCVSRARSANLLLDL